MTDAQVELICMDASLVITSVEKKHTLNPFLTNTTHHDDDNTHASPPTSSTLSSSATVSMLIPTLLELLFYSSESDGLLDPSAQRFLSYVETQHEISIAFEDKLLELFPEECLEYEQTRWKALQVASAGTGAFLNQLTVLTELTTQLAKNNISVFQISTYQTDYVLVKTEDLHRAVYCLQTFCYVTMENGEEFQTNSEAGIKESQETKEHAPREANAELVKGGDNEANDGEDEKEGVATHQHLLSVPDIDLYLIQIDKSCVRRHMYTLVRLLFGQNHHQSTDSQEANGKLFLSYSETGNDISIVTYDQAFVDQVREQTLAGDLGVTVSPDAWKVVQIGDTKLGFAETGIVAGQTRVLVNAGTMVFYLSTFATDFMLIKEDEWDDALPILRRHFNVIEGRFAPLRDRET